MSAGKAKVVDIATGTEWLGGLTQSDTRPSPLTARAERPHWNQYSNRWVWNLRFAWGMLHIDDRSASRALRDLCKGTQRYADASERILRRRQRMWELVEEAVKVPVLGPLTRAELQAFADDIETYGSLHNDADLLLIEARIEAAAPKPPPSPPPRKLTRRKPKALLPPPSGGAA